MASGLLGHLQRCFSLMGSLDVSAETGTDHDFFHPDFPDSGKKRGLSLILWFSSHAITTLRAKPPNRSRTRSRQAESGSSGASSSRGLMTRAHWKIEKSA